MPQKPQISPNYFLITGALGGLGSAFALELAQEGQNLILVDKIPIEPEIAAYLSTRYGVQIGYYSCDLSDAIDRQTLLKTLDNSGCCIRGLINIVGREVEGPFLSQTREDMLNLMNLNMAAAVDLAHWSLNHRDEAERFLIINVASLAGFFSMPQKAVYAASKRFLITFSLALREEIKAFGNVLALCPAGLPTSPESMRKIFLQGFWGRITAQETAVVVRKSIQKARKNRPLYIPGISSRLLVWLARFLPGHWVSAYLARRWGKAQENLAFWRMTERARRAHRD
jgi:hypothetical protein